VKKQASPDGKQEGTYMCQKVEDLFKAAEEKETTQKL